MFRVSSQTQYQISLLLCFLQPPARFHAGNRTNVVWSFNFDFVVDIEKKIERAMIFSSTAYFLTMATDFVNIIRQRWLSWNLLIESDTKWTKKFRSRFIDILKDSDTINHDIFQTKLKYSGIKNTPLGWGRSMSSQQPASHGVTWAISIYFYKFIKYHILNKTIFKKFCCI